MRLDFNAAAVKPADTFEPLPAGWYRAVVDEAELKPTSAGTGSFLALKIKVLGPTHADRVVFGNLTYSNPNAQATEIGQRMISSLCHAINQINLSDTNQLLNKPFMVKLNIKPPVYHVKDKPESGVLYEAGNDVKAFKADEGAGPAVAVAGPGTSPAHAPAAAAAAAAAANPAAGNPATGAKAAPWSN